jgi:bifunctional DNA-binding transcriptional regulator/antitoxin component of YhaV-PrlF toxin-antitoxin module
MPIQTVQMRGQLTLTRDVRRAAGIQPGDLVLTRVTGPGTVEIKRLPRLRLADLLDRYRIEQPVDVAADREAWQDEAAADVLGDSHA